MAPALALLGLLAYSNSYRNPFLMDDAEAIVGNTHIRTLWPLSDVLSAPPQSATAGRPFLSFTLALNYAWGALDPPGYHVANLLIHVLAALALFGCVRRALQLRGLPPDLQDSASVLAAGVAALWLLHPVQAEVMNYVVQRSESLMGLLYLLTLYAAIRVMTSADGAARWWTAVAILCGALGMATKESMVTAPVVVLLFDGIFVSGSLWSALRSRPGLYAGLAAGWVLLGALVAGGPRSRSAGFSAGVGVATYVYNQAGMIATYFKLAFWPHPLIADYGVPQGISLQQAIAPGLVVVGLLLVAAYALWRWPRAGFLAAVAFITLAPTSSIVPIATEVGAERRMYLPLAAIITLVVVSAWHFVAGGVRAMHPMVRRPAAVFAVVLIAASGAVTYARNRDYRDDTILWRQVIANHPHGRAHYNLGIALKNRGDVDAALAEYRLAAPDWFPAHYALGFELQRRGRLDEALGEYREFINRAGNDVRVPDAWALVGHASLAKGAAADAERAFATTLAMRPEDTSALGGRADALLELRRFAEAAGAYQAFLKLSPQSTAGFSNLGRAYLELERPDQAAAAFARAVALSPNDPMMRLNYGMALGEKGELLSAIDQFRAGLRIAPDHVPLLDSLATALAAVGQREMARATFQRALALAPDDPQTLEDYRATFGPSVR